MAATESRGSNAPHSGLHQQDLSKLDVSKLTAVSPEVISRQATINIGTIGHVAHGKSTVVKAISGVQTVRFKNELERNITIKLERLPEAVIQKYARPSSSASGKRKRDREGARPTKRPRKDQTYVVEQILGVTAADARPLFLIKWKGWPHSTNTWEPMDNLLCPVLLRAFLDKQIGAVAALRNELLPATLRERSQLEARWRLQGHTRCDLEQVDADLLALAALHGEGDSNRQEEVDELEKRLRNGLQAVELHTRRATQLLLLRQWERMLNSQDPDGKIRVENEVDLEEPPEDFQFITRNVPAPGVLVPEDPPIGCECSACNGRTRCSCALEGGLFAYSAKKRLRVAVGTPIYECNKACRCPPDCLNRLVQSGRRVRLLIFRTHFCGWGVRAAQRIPSGSFVTLYLGEIIPCEEAERRARATPLTAPTYLFDLDFNSADSLYTVDAARMGNISHFINHSCAPNLAVWAVWADCLDPNLPMLALFATRDIADGEEINFDYAQNTSDGTESQEDGVSNTPGGVNTPTGDNNQAVEKSPAGDKTPVGDKTPKKNGSLQNGGVVAASPRSPLKLRLDLGRAERPPCRCGALNCRKYLF